MKKLNYPSLYVYALAFLIPFSYFINLNWDASSIVNSHQNKNAYFGADVARVVDNLEDSKESSHYRDRMHPYFSIVAVSVSKLGVYFGYKNLAFPIYKLIFGTFGVFLFWLFIYANTDIFQAFASLALLFSCMSFRVWTAIPETFLFSFFTLMLALNLMRLKHKPEFILFSTLAGTVTNIMLGLMHLVLDQQNKKAIVKIILGFSFMAVIAALVQQSIYPTSTYFFDVLGYQEELDYIIKDLSSTQFRLFDFLMSGFILPLTNDISLPITTAHLWQQFFSVEFLASKRMMLFTILTMATIAATYLLALYGFFKNKQKNKISQSILFFLGFELVLHLFYGDDPFLYSLNFTPLIIIFMSLHQPEKIKAASPYLFVFLALLIQRFNFLDPSIFAKYFF